MDHAARCNLLAAEVERAADVVAGVPFDAPVPSCPEWRVWDLVLHLGRVHRWVDRLVATLADGPQAAADAFADSGPPSAEWLQAGGTALVATLRAADPDASMWAWGADQHVRFWSRRQLHETLMHRVDVELAGGFSSAGDPQVAADGIDELLVNLPSAARFSPKVGNVHGAGNRLAIVPDDVDQHWTITLEEDGFSDDPTSRPADAVLSGAAFEILLVLYRRRTLDAADIDVSAHRELVEFWLANTGLE